MGADAVSPETHRPPGPLQTGCNHTQSLQWTTQLVHKGQSEELRSRGRKSTMRRNRNSWSRNMWNRRWKIGGLVEYVAHSMQYTLMEYAVHYMQY